MDLSWDSNTSLRNSCFVKTRWLHQKSPEACSSGPSPWKLRNHDVKLALNARFSLYQKSEARMPQQVQQVSIQPQVSMSSWLRVVFFFLFWPFLVGENDRKKMWCVGWGGGRACTKLRAHKMDEYRWCDAMLQVLALVEHSGLSTILEHESSSQPSM